MVGKRFPRSIRNNNPFNLKCGLNNWIGLVAINNDYQHTFEQFQDMYYGLRAGQKLILNYMFLYGLRTIRSIIERFAPSTENYTSRYIDFCCRNDIGKKVYDADDEICTLSHFFHLCARICKYESGANYTMLHNLHCDDEGQKLIYNTYFRGVSKYNDLFNDLKK